MAYSLQSEAKRQRFSNSAQPIAGWESARIVVMAQDLEVCAQITEVLQQERHTAIVVQKTEDIIRQLSVYPSQISQPSPPSPSWARSATQTFTHSSIDLILFAGTDAGNELQALLEPMRALGSTVPVVLIGTLTDAAAALAAVRQGAYDYVPRPLEQEQLRAAVHRALEYRRVTRQNEIYRHELELLVAARTEMLQRAMRDLERSYDITLEALGDALDLKDSETEGHSQRVTAYTVAMGRAMGLNENELRVIGRAAFLHDIGKMAIPDAILRKPEKLTEEERAMMREHCERGYRMLRKIPFLREAAEIVYSHQERYDGKGYPRGLSGDQIHIGARIFSIADTLDAITSDRPYRGANSFSAAQAEILRCSGTQFDPAIVDVFLQTPYSTWVELRKEITLQSGKFSPFTSVLAGSHPHTSEPHS